MKCPICGYVPKSYEEHYLEEKGECFECSLWRKRLSRVNDPDIAIIDGTFYSIGDEDDPSSSRGFGGKKFVIHSKYGKEIITTNLWCGGKIPKVWKPKFPNNAEFFDCNLEERLKHYNYDFIPKEND